MEVVKQFLAQFRLLVLGCRGHALACQFDKGLLGIERLLAWQILTLDIAAVGLHFPDVPGAGELHIQDETQFLLQPGVLDAAAGEERKRPGGVT